MCEIVVIEFLIFWRRQFAPPTAGAPLEGKGRKNAEKRKPIRTGRRVFGLDQDFLKCVYEIVVN